MNKNQQAAMDGQTVNNTKKHMSLWAPSCSGRKIQFQCKKKKYAENIYSNFL